MVVGTRQLNTLTRNGQPAPWPGAERVESIVRHRAHVHVCLHLHLHLHLRLHLCRTNKHGTSRRESGFQLAATPRACLPICLSSRLPAHLPTYLPACLPTCLIEHLNLLSQP
jgi:hypothetical protein